MFPKPFNYVAPATLSEALELLKRHGEGARVLAGGQSLIPLMKLRFFELENVIERAVLLGKGDLITRADLPQHITAGGPSRTISAAAGRTLKEALEEPEREIILEVLRASNWNRHLTADRLGINRTTLYKKMKRLGLEDPLIVPQED